MPGETPESIIQALMDNIVETESEGKINGTHFMQALGAIDGFAKIFALAQIYHIPCEDMRVEIGGLLRLFSDFVLSGRIDDYEIFCDRGIELTKRWEPLLKERSEKTLLGKTGFYKGFPEIKKRESPVESCANCEFNTACIVQTGYCPSWKKG